MLCYSSFFREGETKALKVKWFVSGHTGSPWQGCELSASSCKNCTVSLGNMNSRKDGS